jgi:hypothetical protein
MAPRIGLIGVCFMDGIEGPNGFMMWPKWRKTRPSTPPDPEHSARASKFQQSARDPNNRHPRLCQGTNVFGSPCGQWALKGESFCQRHLLQHREELKQFTRQWRRAVQFYGEGLTENIQKRLAALADSPDILSLNEEVAVTRMLAGEALVLLSAAEKANSVDAKASAIDAVTASVDHVRRMVESMARIEAVLKDKVSQSHLTFLVSKILVIIQQNCDEDLAQELADQINAIEMPHDDFNPVVALRIGTND